MVDFLYASFCFFLEYIKVCRCFFIALLQHAYEKSCRFDAKIRIYSCLFNDGANNKYLVKMII